MTDKEIIIDDVDISGCEYCLKMTKYRCAIQRDVYKCLCEENPNCHYKQLKRKEQEEYETLKLLKNCFDKASRLQEKNEKLTYEYEVVKQCNESLMQTLEDVRKEKELLKKQVCGLRPELKHLINEICHNYNIEAKTYHEKIVEIIHNLDKYKQALDEIEQEVKWVVDNRECYELRDADRYKRILDIINKVEEK